MEHNDITVVSLDTQNERIIAYLKKHGKINPMQALRDLSVMRLASRISELRDMNAPIEKEMKTTVNQFGEHVRYAEYKLLDLTWELNKQKEGA